MFKDSCKKHLTAPNIALGILMLAFCGIMVRLVYLQVVCHDLLKKKTEAQSLQYIEQLAYRGPILDSKGRALAYSIKVDTIYVSPAELCQGGNKQDVIARVEKAAQFLSERLKLPLKEVREKCQTTEVRDGLLRYKTFEFIKRKLSQEESQAIAGGLPAGIHIIKEAKRVYPCNSLASTIVGFEGMDNQGMEGIEASFNKDLIGHPGKWITYVDALGNRIALDDTEDPNLPGNTVVLTIDSAIQHFAEEALKKTCEAHQPREGGTAVVLDTTTGDVLAIANWPDYDLNAPGRYRPEERRNRAITDIYEPGSTWKTFTAAKVLDLGLSNFNETFNCENGAWKVPGISRTVHDSHSLGTIKPFWECYSKSSNIWAAKLGIFKLGKENLYRTVVDFGFGEPTGIKFPGERSGLITPLRRIDLYAMSSIPYGQQIACSALQLANAYTAVVNGGQLFQPHLVKCVLSPTGEVVKEFKPKVRRQVISPETSGKMRELMGMVVSVGTGSKSKLGLYDVGGKTGTAQKYISGGGVSGAYMSSFCGVAPIKNPRICVLVVINEPTRGGYYGGTVACPPVREIILKTLLYLKVEPDHPEAPLDEV